MQTPAQRCQTAEEEERARRSDNAATPLVPVTPATASESSAPAAPAAQGLIVSRPSPGSPVSPLATPQPSQNAPSAAPRSFTLGPSRINRLRNGDPSKAGAVQLIVYGRSADQLDTAVALVKRALLLWTPAVLVPRLDIRGAEPRALHSHQHAVRISWTEDVWVEDRDQVADMVKIHERLKEAGHEVFWVNGPSEDLRSSLDVEFRAINPPSSDATSFTLGAANGWLRSYLADNDLKLVEDARFGELKNDAVCVFLRLFTPSDAERLAARIEEDKPVFAGHQLALSRSQRRINVAYPTSIVSSGRRVRSIPFLVQELQSWVDDYNADTGLTESLLELETGQLAEILLDKHLVVTPSSMGLAHYLVSQKPYYGPAYETCYELNGRHLVTRREAEEQQSRQEQEDMNALSAEVSQLETEIDELESHLDEVFNAVSTHQTAFVSFAQNSNDSFRTLITEERSWLSRQSRINLLSSRLGNLENHRESLRLQKALETARLQPPPPEANPLQNDVVLLEQHRESIEARIRGVREELNMLLAQPLPMVSPRDSTGLGLLGTNTLQSDDRGGPSSQRASRRPRGA